MIVGGIQFDNRVRGAVLASGEAKVRLSELLRQWTEPRRPAILFVLVGESPFVGVYAEDHLLDIFPGARLVPAEPVEGGARGPYWSSSRTTRGPRFSCSRTPRHVPRHRMPVASPALSLGHLGRRAR